MLVTITSKRQVTFPAAVLAALGVNAGDRLELHPSPDGYLLRAKWVGRSRLAPLKGKLPKPGTAFNIDTFREQAASNMVIGEAYVAMQHHYRVGKADAKAGLRSVLTSGLVAPLGGDAVLDALDTNRGCGLLDRLIALQYSGGGLGTLTPDRKMAGLPGVMRLGGKPPGR